MKKDAGKSEYEGKVGKLYLIKEAKKPWDRETFKILHMNLIEILRIILY